MSVTIDQFQDIIDDMLEGLSLSKCLKKHGVTPYQFAKFTSENPLRERAYAHAQQIKAELMADEIIEISDTDEDPQRARNRIDTRKWVASKYKPHKYGERIEMALTGNIDLTAALSEARRRVVLPASYQQNAEDAQVIETIKLPNPNNTGSQPVDATAPNPQINASPDPKPAK